MSRRKLSPPQGGRGLHWGGLSRPQNAGMGGVPPAASGAGAGLVISQGAATFEWYPQLYGTDCAVDSLGCAITATQFGNVGTTDTRGGLLGLSHDGAGSGLRFPYPGSASLAACPNRQLTAYLLFEFAGTGTDDLFALGPDSAVERLGMSTTQFRNVNAIHESGGVLTQALAGNAFGPTRTCFALEAVYDDVGGGDAEVVRAGWNGDATPTVTTGQNLSDLMRGNDVDLGFVILNMEHTGQGGNTGQAWCATLLVVEGAGIDQNIMTQLLTRPHGYRLPPSVSPSSARLVYEPGMHPFQDVLNGIDLLPPSSTENPVFESRGTGFAAVFDGADDQLVNDDGSFQLGDASGDLVATYTVYCVSDHAAGIISGLWQVDDKDDAANENFAGVTRTGASFGTGATATEAGTQAFQYSGTGAILGQVQVATVEKTPTQIQSWLDGVSAGALASTVVPRAMDRITIGRSEKVNFFANGGIFYLLIVEGARDPAVETWLNSNFPVGESV